MWLSPVSHRQMGCKKIALAYFSLSCHQLQFCLMVTHYELCLPTHLCVMCLEGSYALCKGKVFRRNNQSIRFIRYFSSG